VTDVRIQNALERAVALGEVGVQVAAYQGHQLVIDEWIGSKDEPSGVPVDGDTLFSVFSVSKALVTTALHLQADRGLLSTDAPIADYWPEYAANGKSNITLRHVLQHRAGVPQMPSSLSPERMADWDGIVAWLADVTPLCPPGQRSMYHSLSYGYILGEVIRRTDPRHRQFGDFLREEICAPLDIKDLWVGLPAEQERRVATLTWGAVPPAAPQVAPSPIRKLMMPAAISPVPDIWNAPAMRAAVIPAASGIMTARDGARFMALLANRGELSGTRLISQERLMALTEPRPNPLERDEGIGMITSNGVGGFWVGGKHPHTDPVMGRATNLLAHGGAGGSYAWADLDARVAVMITHNRMFGALPDDEHPFIGLADAVRAVTGS
jgi:CubicO group peptidase (beta-lactamase class C family)